MGRGTAAVASDRLVVVSDSHEDAEWLRRDLVMLQPLVRNRRLEVWADEHIQVGDDWWRDIDDGADRAAAALLPVSPDLLASHGADVPGRAPPMPRRDLSGPAPWWTSAASPRW
jgi:TIR domain